MRILLASDSPAHTTGYANLGRSLAKRLLADGHEPIIFSPGGLYGTEPITIDGIKVLGAAWNDDRAGNSTIRHHLARQNPDLLITLLDAQGLQAYGWDSVPWLAWAPIDSWPLPKQEAGQLGRAARVVVPSKWGVEVARAAGVACQYLPYAIESTDFTFSAAGRARFRQMIGVTDEQFLIGLVGLNYNCPDRKGFGWAFEAIGELHQRYDNVRAWCQTNPETGMDLFAIRGCLGLDNVIGLPKSPPIGSLPQNAVRDMYSAFDVLLQASTTEGFGLPVVEAQAGGCPVVVNAATSLSELCGPGGSPAQPLGHAWIETGTRVSVPSVHELTVALEQQYRTHRFFQETEHSPPPREAPIARQRLGWAQQFDWDHVYRSFWRPLLTDMPQRLEPEKTAQRKLQLGCGNNPHPGFVHHDRYRHAEHVDVVHDLATFPYPWDDASFDYVVVEDVLEHLRGSLAEVLDELHRILATDGYLFIRTCEAGSWMHAYDPTHVRGFMLDSFDYWDPETNAGAAYGMEIGERKWKILRRSLHGQGEIEILMQPRRMATAVVPPVEVRDLVAAD